jgi:hypothetical protein
VGSETPIMRSTCGFAAGGEDEPATLRKLGKRVSPLEDAARNPRVSDRGCTSMSSSGTFRADVRHRNFTTSQLMNVSCLSPVQMSIPGPPSRS